MKRQEKDRSRTILGIDPGSIVCGYGIISSGLPSYSSSSPSYISSGRIVMSSGRDLHDRLKEIYDSLREIIMEYLPDEVAIEKVFFAKNVKSAITLGQARGAALLAAASSGLPIYEYSALEVKKAVVGYGRAEKKQVIMMISQILNLKSGLSSDSADALALALCHTNTMRIMR